MSKVTKIKKVGHEVGYSPTHPNVENWWFSQDEEKLAVLANAIANIAEDTGLSRNDLQHLFPYILRMLKVDSVWSE